MQTSGGGASVVSPADSRPLFTRLTSKLAYVSSTANANANTAYPMLALVRSDHIYRCSRIHLVCAFGPCTIYLKGQSDYDRGDAAIIEAEQEVILRFKADFAPPLEVSGRYPMLTDRQREGYLDALQFNGGGGSSSGTKRSSTPEGRARAPSIGSSFDLGAGENGDFGDNDVGSVGSGIAKVGNLGTPSKGNYTYIYVYVCMCVWMYCYIML